MIYACGTDSLTMGRGRNGSSQYASKTAKLFDRILRLAVRPPFKLIFELRLSTPSVRNKTRSAPIYITKKHLGVSALSTIPKDSERPVILGEYIIEHKATVRQAASE